MASSFLFGLLPERMLAEECPHQARRIDAPGRTTDEPFRELHAARPGVPSAPNRVEHDRRIVSALLVLTTRDIRRSFRFDRIALALVSSRPIRCPPRYVRPWSW